MATMLRSLRSSTGYKTAAFAPKAAWMALKSLAGAPKSVWLTFDDGPHPAHTARVLEILGKRSIRATFFFIGRNALREPRLVRDAFAAGHRIGNHTFTHPDLRTLGRDAVSTRDWSEGYQPDRWVRHGARLVRLWDESRILLHDNLATTADNLDAFLDRLDRIGGVEFMAPDTV